MYTARHVERIWIKHSKLVIFPLITAAKNSLNQISWPNDVIKITRRISARQCHTCINLYAHNAYNVP